MEKPNTIRVGTVTSFNVGRGFGFVYPSRLEPYLLERFAHLRGQTFFHGNAYREPIVGDRVGMVFAPEGWTQRCPKAGDVVLFTQTGSDRGPRVHSWCYEADAKAAALKLNLRFPLRLVVSSMFEDCSIVVWEGSDVSEVTAHLPFHSDDDNGGIDFELSLEDFRRWRESRASKLLNDVPQDSYLNLLSSGSYAMFERRQGDSWVPCLDPRSLPFWDALLR